MYKHLKELFQVFSKIENRKFRKLQYWVLLMTFFQVASIASFAPFISMISDISVLERENVLSEIYQISDLTNIQFVIYSGIMLIILISISSFLSIRVNWALFKYSNSLGMNLSTRLLRYYLGKDYLFHVTNSNSLLMKQVLVETRRVGDGIISPMIQLISQLAFIIIVVVVLIFYSPVVAISGGAILFGLYIVIYLLTKNKIQINGQNITDKSMLRSKITLNSFGAIRDIIHLGKRDFFVDKFKLVSDSFARSQALNSTFSMFPKYIVELVSLGGFVLVLVLLFNPVSDSFTQLVPTFVVFSLLLLKLIPAFQAVFGSLAKIKANLPAFDSLRDDFMKINFDEENIGNDKQILFEKDIEIRNLDYKYPGERKSVLNGINITIQKNSTIGLVGYSGSGKSTLVDVLVGFLTFNQGSILVDGTALTTETHTQFKKNIGFVSQNIFLLDASIKENIAFGINPIQIDEQKLMNAIKQASLEGLLKDLPNGIHTEVGERGIQLSGGQVQRIAIARALYTECEVLIFDEATSALDGITEKNILDSITNLQGTKTIIMIAHRLTTLIGCDSIYVLDKGKVDDVGDFEDLSKNNELFRKMLKDD